MSDGKAVPQRQRDTPDPDLPPEKALVDSAQAGNAVAQFRLATDLATRPARIRQALDWLQRSAAQHYPPALCDLSCCHERGACGLTPNALTAFCYATAASLYVDLGKALIGRAYARGIGAPVDIPKALSYLEPVRLLLLPVVF
jgi:TPR repeat protein